MRTGLHANQTRDHTKILDYYRRSGSNVFKTLTFDDALLDGLKGLGVTIIGRLHRDRQELGGSVASTFVRDLVASARRHPQVDFWEGWNEAFHVASEIGRYAEFEIERMKALEAVGKKAAIACFSTGTPEITDGGATWARFRPALEHARAHRHALALHEYGGPYMQYMTETPDGRNQWKQGAFTGASPDPSVYDASGLEGFLCLRYRKVYRLLRAWGIGDLQLFITEGGIDDTMPRPGPGGKGYKAFRDGTWDRLPGIGDYAQQRFWYMEQVSRDPYVAGVVDFGWDGTSTGWPDFDLSTDPAMVNRIIQLESALPAGHQTGGGTTVPSMTHLVDVSRWQGQIDWSRLAGQAQGAWIKAAQGTTGIDPQYARNAAGAAAVHLPFGPYHYWVARLDPAAQAEHFHRTVQAAGAVPALPPMVDLEDPDAGLVNPDELRRYVDRVRELFGTLPLVYTGAAWWTPGRFMGGAAPRWAADLLLWIARYGTNDPDASSAPPIVPAPWGKWTIHQYTSRGPGAKYGASSEYIDLNRSPLTIDQLKALAGRPAAPVLDWAGLIAAAREEHEASGIHLSKASALQAAIKAAGQDIVTRERDWEDASGRYVYEIGQNRATMERTVYVWDGRTGTIQTKAVA